MLIFKNKTELRKIFRKLRKAFLPKEEAAIKATLHLIAHPIFQKAKHIAVYLNHGSEISTTYLIKSIWQQEKKCYLPCINENKLAFALYHQNIILLPNQLNILEPAAKEIISNAKLNLVIVPLLAFDEKGNRLGQGQGFYDKTFAELKNRPLLMGFAFDLQKTKKLPHDDWDVHLDGVVTESGMHFFRQH